MKNLQYRLFDTLFLDIETVSQKSSFLELSSSSQSLWEHKASILAKRSWLNVTPQLIEDMYEQKAAIYAEFGKIVCISVGKFVIENETVKLKTKSFYGEDESLIIRDFLEMVKKRFNNPDRHYFCGHNIREFDIPYICRRAMVNGQLLPSTLNISGLKAWQLHHLRDTLQMWKFGDYKHYSSLALMCNLFGIPSPKGDIDGSKVGEVYWEESALEKIVTYCEQDVAAVAYLYAKMIGRNDLKMDVIESETIREVEVKELNNSEAILAKNV